MVKYCRSCYDIVSLVQFNSPGNVTDLEHDPGLEQLFQIRLLI